MDGTASAIITAALVLCSIGVWSERLGGRLRPFAGDLADPVLRPMFFALATR